MAKAALAQVRVDTNFACASGVPKAFIERVLAASAQPRLRGDSRISLDLPLDDAAIAEVTGGRVLRLCYVDGTADEWRIDRLTTEAAPSGEVRRVSAAAPLYDLGAVGPIAEYDSAGVPSFSGIRYAITPSDVITTVIIPWLQAQGIDWVAEGTIDPTAPIAEISWENVTPLGLLHQLEELTGCELGFRANGSTEYLIDLRTQTASSQPIADLRAGKQITGLALTEDATQRYSALTALGAADPAGRRAVLGRAVWQVAARNTTTDRLQLTDPEGGDDPILEDDQLNGLYLYDLQGGATTAIVDTFSATQEVQVADASLFTIGQLLEVRAGAGSGTYKDNAPLLTTLTRPSITPTRVGTHDRPDLAGERNLVGNGWFSAWTNGPHAAPDRWTLHAGALAYDLRDSTYAERGLYALQLRFAPYQATATTLTSGQDTVTGIDGGYFHIGQVVEVAGYLGAWETRTVIAKTATTVQLSSGVGYTHSLTTYLRAQGATFPINPASTYGWPGIVSDIIRAPVAGGALFHGMAKLMLLGLPVGQYQAVVYLEHYNSSNIRIRRLEAKTTVLDQWVTLDIPTQAVAGESLRLGIELKPDPSYPGVVPTHQLASTGRLLIDAAGITQTDYTPAEIPNYSAANALWQSTNRALGSSSAGTSYEVRLVDLTALDATGWPDDELVLGATVRVNDHRTGLSNQLLRIVELNRPNLFRPSECTVVLNERRPDLTEIIDRAIRGSSGGGVAPAASGSGGPTGTPPAPALVPVKIAFHASGDASAPVPLTLGAHGATETEVDTGLRAWVDTNNAAKLRLETIVDTVGATGAKIVAKYSTDSGTTWDYLDGSAEPFVAITAVGPQKGNEIVPVVRGDVLVGLFMVGGNNVTSPILRNTALYVWYAVLAAPVPTPTPPTPAPVVSLCGLSPDAVQGDNFAGGLGMTNWADDADFVANAGGGRKVYNTGIFGTDGVDVTFDAADQVGGHRSLVLTYQDSGNTGQFWNTRLSDGVGPTETAVEYDDLWYRIALKVPSAFTSIPTPSASPAKPSGEPGDHAYGFNLLQFSPFDSGTNLSAWRDLSFWLSLKGDGRLYVESLWYEHPTLHWGQTDIGAASLLADDAWHDLILRVRRKPGDDTSVRLTVYIGDVCETGLSALATVDIGPHADLLNSVGRSVTGGWGFIQVPGYIDTNGSAFGPHDVKVGRHEVVPTARNANPFLTT